MTWGYFKIGKFHKNKRDETFEKASAGKLDVVLTTYETLRNHWVSADCSNVTCIRQTDLKRGRGPRR
jgi:hypothetical protein